MTQYALVRDIPESFDQCIKPEGNPQPIDVALARQQHARYYEALLARGRILLHLPADARFPDCPFVEDTAVVVGNRALITRTGAESRRGEVQATREVLKHFLKTERMEPPATLEGGDVLQIGEKIFVGRTARTNEAGIQALSRWAETSRKVIPVTLSGALHLKSLVNALGKDTVVVSREGVDLAPFSGFKILCAPPDEGDRLSFLPLGDDVLLPRDCPKTATLFQEAGYHPVPLDLSEIRKAQAGLTCMSVLFEA